MGQGENEGDRSGHGPVEGSGYGPIEGRRHGPVEGRSKVDAMGNDKRRAVIGEQYGATVRKRLLVYGAVVAVIFVAVVAFLTVVTNYDNRDQPLKNTAPWAVSDNTEPPRDVDFKANGPRVCPRPCASDITMPADEILNR
ncbi:MAG: hypothetical protein KDB58_11020 [Solirubrobacterales bacterium]|nr:hypothetical protein [Solirubrobacterales bacterium]MCB8970606.1 hypothetical protein [Thermoleophilales bacterium]MCO5325768.1 hypothetical protein [Solirubrobacterales bacterium]